MTTNASNIEALSTLFLNARHTGTCIERTPQGFAPHDTIEAYAVQDRVAETLGPVRGWKVGARTPEAEPFCAPLHESTIFCDVDTLPKGICRLFGIEAEIVYRFCTDLLPRDTPWTEQEVRAAIATAHPAIEIFDSRFCVAGSQDPLSHMADQGNHGALIVGSAFEAWADLDPVDEPVALTINGDCVQNHRGGNSAGEPIRLLVWLANHAAARGKPIRAGDVVTTGSMTGTVFVDAEAQVDVTFGTLGTVRVFLSE